MSQKQAELVAHEFIKAIRARDIRVQEAFLFGSHARGLADEDSDIDIAVISPDFGHDYLEEAVMLKKISEDIDLDISPRPYSSEEFRQATRGQFLHDEIIRKGTPIRA